MMLVDYHIHSEFSDDSHELMEIQIEEAINRKIEEICFCDHVDYGIKKDWDEGDIEYRKGDGISNDDDKLEPLANVDYPKYFMKLKEMKEKYASSISIKQGLEFGIQTSTIDKYNKLYNQYQNELDFVLLSVHQIDNLELWTQDYQKGKTQAEYNIGYYKEIYNIMKHYNNYSVLAHLNLIERYDLEGIYPFEEIKDIIAEILKLAILNNKGIEINTSNYHYGIKETFPNMEILKLYKDLGGKIITIGSDAHSRKYIGDHIENTLMFLKEAIGLKEICIFNKMLPSFINI